MRELVMATNNAHKLREIRQMTLGHGITIKSLADLGCEADIPETHDTLEDNALEKARFVAERHGVDCFADDTGLEVEALDGRPGVYTARWAAVNSFGEAHDSDANMRCILHMLQGESNRKARFRTVIALIQGGRETLFEGIVEGHITLSPQGEQGFGYDPVFAPTEAGGLTFAEMGPDEKNRISHRARAIKQLIEHLT